MSASDEEPRQAGTAGRRFETTRWSVVLAAASGDEPRAREALSTLCELYWYPLYAFVRSGGSSPAEAEDLTQGFFTHLLEKDALHRVDPRKGTFRSFLLASFRNFITDERVRQNALKRGGGAAIRSLDAATAERRFLVEPGHDETPERIFLRQWAVRVLERALERLRDRYARSGKSDQFEALKVFLSGEARPVPQAEVAAQLGVTVLAVKVAVHRLRKRFRDALRDEVVCTVEADADIDAEIRALYGALGS